MEYQWNGTRTTIGATQQLGWHALQSQRLSLGDIPIQQAATYTVTLTGLGALPDPCHRVANTQLVIKTDYTETANYSASIVIPQTRNCFAT